MLAVDYKMEPSRHGRACIYFKSTSTFWGQRPSLESVLYWVLWVVFVASSLGRDSGASWCPFIFSSNHSSTESVRVQLRSLFHAQAKLQAVICEGVSACRAWSRIGALNILLSGSSQSRPPKPINHPWLTEQQMGAELGGGLKMTPWLGGETFLWSGKGECQLWGWEQGERRGKTLLLGHVGDLLGI